MLYMPGKNIKRNSAFTLAEVIIAVSITAVIALIATTFTVSMMNSRNIVDQEYELSRSGDITLSRVKKLISESQLVFDCDSDRILLWTGDNKDYGLVNLSELAVAIYDSDSNTVTIKTLGVPQWATPADVEAADADTNVNVIMQWVDDNNPFERSMYITSDLVLENVSSASFSTDQPAPFSKRVKFDMTLSSGNISRSFSIAATLRRDVTELVKKTGGNYYLDSDYNVRDPSYADISNVMAN